MYDLKGSKKLLSRPRTGQFSRTCRIRGQGLDFRGQGLQKLLEDVLEAKDVFEAVA